MSQSVVIKGSYALGVEQKSSNNLKKVFDGQKGKKAKKQKTKRTGIFRVHQSFETWGQVLTYNLSGSRSLLWKRNNKL